MGVPVPERFALDGLILRRALVADATALFEAYAGDPEATRWLDTYVRGGYEGEHIFPQAPCDPPITQVKHLGSAFRRQSFYRPAFYSYQLRMNSALAAVNTPRGMRRGDHGRRGGKKSPAARAQPRATFFPAAFRAPPRRRATRRVPRGVHEHGRLPMGAAPRIASINFAIAYTLIYYPIKVFTKLFQ